MEKLLEVKNLKVSFFTDLGEAQAVKDAGFAIEEGDFFGIVGESGCGKSTLGKAICKLIEPTDGKIILDGEDIRGYNSKKMRNVRKKVQMVFQDPYASLNPRMSIHDILAEPLQIHGLVKGKQEIDEAVVRLLREVGMDDYHARRYPHEFSGGQRQRIGIARALAANPEFIVCDEPISALDVSIQAQVINILEDIIETNGLGTVCGTSGGQPTDMEEIVRLNPDVVLVDFLMPEKDGIQLVRELKEAGCGSRFIMISQVSAKELIGKAYSAGIDFFISKPINIIEVKSVIENVERQIQNERTLSNIRKMFLAEMKEEVPEEKKKNDGYVKKLQVILNRIGMSGEKGCDDIIKICQYLHANHKPISQVQHRPAVRDSERRAQEHGAESCAAPLP